MTPQEAAQLVVCAQELRKATRRLDHHVAEIARYLEPFLEVADQLDSMACPIEVKGKL